MLRLPPAIHLKPLTAAITGAQQEAEKNILISTDDLWHNYKFSASLFGLCQLLLNEALFNADGGIQRPHSSPFRRASLLLITIYRPPLSTRATHTNNMFKGRQWGVPCDGNNRMSQPYKSVCVCVCVCVREREPPVSSIRFSKSRTFVNLLHQN